jgi:hypothetical protein
MALPELARRRQHHTVPIETSARKAVAGIAGSRLIEYDGAPHVLLATHKEQRTVPSAG